MSTIVYSKGVFVTDRGFINYCNGNQFFSHDRTKTKLAISKHNVLAIGSTGIYLEKDGLQKVADFLECVLRRDGIISLYDDTTKDVLKRIAYINCSELSFLLMEKIGNSAYHIDLRAGDDNKLVIDISRISYDDSFAIGSGSMLALGALATGMDTIDAVRYAVTNDGLSQSPLEFVLMKNLSAITNDDENDTAYLEFIKTTLKRYETKTKNNQ